jgi:hypothetical protein
MQGLTLLAVFTHNGGPIMLLLVVRDVHFVGWCWGVIFVAIFIVQRKDVVEHGTRDSHLLYKVSEMQESCYRLYGVGHIQYLLCSISEKVHIGGWWNSRDWRKLDEEQGLSLGGIYTSSEI